MALRIRRGTSAERLTYTALDGELIYDTTDKALYVGDGITAGGKLLASGGTIIEDLVLNGNDITGTGNIDITGDIEVTGNIHATGTITADGDITIGNDNSDNVVFNADINSNLIPNVNNTFNLGAAPNNRWNNVFAGTIEADTVNADTVGYHTGDVTGSVFSDGSVMLVDGTNGRIVGPVFANVTGNVTGSVTGNVIGNVLGNVNGNLEGGVVGTFVGAIQGPDGDVFFDTRLGPNIVLPANLNGDVLGGNLVGADSTILVNGGTNSIQTNGTVNSVVPTISGVHSVGDQNSTFLEAHLDYQIKLGGLPIRVEEISGADRITVTGGVNNRLPVSTTLTTQIPTGIRNSFTVANTDGIRPGAIFDSLPGVGERIVSSAVGGVVTTTQTFSVTEDGANAPGTPITFFNPPVRGVNFRHSVPPTSKGEPGDGPGMVFANDNYIYFCVAPWNGSNDIWVRQSVILVAW